MKRKGNILIMTLLACTLLALLLVAGVAVATSRTVENENKLDSIKLEQLHRTAMDDAIAQANANAPVHLGDVLVDDEPLAGQHRRIVVSSIDAGCVKVKSEVGLADGSKRSHESQWLTLTLEPRMAFGQDAIALFYGGCRLVVTRWLKNHASQDVVLLASTNKLKIADGGAPPHPMQGSVYVCALEGETLEATLLSSLDCAASFVCTGSLRMNADLSCQKAWIDGTLTIGEGAQLTAEAVILQEDPSAETLEKINAARIYMPHPPEPEESEEGEEEEDDGRELLPLSDIPSQGEGRKVYLMMQALN